jgi:hypothetical protein
LPAQCALPSTRSTPRSPIYGWIGAGLAAATSQELLTLSGLEEVLDGAEVVSLLNRGFRGTTKGRDHWHAPVGDRRTRDRLSHTQRPFNRVQAGVHCGAGDQAPGQRVGAASLARAAVRVRESSGPPTALVYLGRWLHRVPMWSSITDTLNDTRLGAPG